MKYCPSCKNKIEKGEKFCKVCGMMLDDNSAENKTESFIRTAAENAVYNFANTANTTAEYSIDDINKNRVMSAVSYIGILFLIPILRKSTDKSPFLRYHVNQSILLFIISFIGFLTVMIPQIGWIIATVFSVFSFALFIIGVKNALKGEAKELPVIGRIRILK